MGVRGLTSYIYSRENLYFDSTTLSNCAIIIDGNGLAPFLYNSQLVPTSPFGGDYDKIGAVTETFFKRLLSNKVYPIVVLDGAVERRKFLTTKNRCRDKVISLQNVTPAKVNCQCFPLLMRNAFREKLVDMGIIVLRTDLEADGEIAALAKFYGVPVLANDSDFFIYDVFYIPISMLSFGNGPNSEIKCKVFRMDKFLQLMNLDRAKLPLLAVILGNDYIQRSEFRQFFGQIKLGKNCRTPYTQKIIAGVLRWLKSESVESALQKILNCMRSRGREALRQKTRKIMKEYTKLNSDLKNYVGDPSKMKPILLPSDSTLEDVMAEMALNDEESDDLESEDDGALPKLSTQGESSSSKALGYCSSDGEVEESDVVLVEDIERLIEEPEENPLISLLPTWLMQRSRRGLVDPEILTLLNLKIFLSTPQTECYEMSYSGEPYNQILQCVAGILLGPTEIQYWHRQHRNKYERTTLQTITETSTFGKFPGLEELGSLSLKERIAIFNSVMNVEENDFKSVPAEWRVYFACVKYWLSNDSNNELKPHHIHAVIMMLIAPLVIDSKIGYHRIRKSFIRKYGSVVNKLSKSREHIKNCSFQVYDSVSLALKNVTKEDCIFIFDELLPYFQVDRLTCYPKHFSSNLVHSFARLQSCISLTSMLNNLLLKPYPDVTIHKFYDGTFLYNFAGNLKNRTNILNYVDSFLGKVPSLLALYHVIYETFLKTSPRVTTQRRSKKKTRKTKTKTEPLSVQNSIAQQTFDSDSEPFFDKNNRFCGVFS